MADSRYTLMHKNIPVAELSLDDASGFIAEISHVYSAEHTPVGIPVGRLGIDRAALNEWWKGRAIPASRDGIRDVLQELNLVSSQKLLEKCLGLSLSDQYWICPAGSDLKWSQVNFFENPFSEDMGNILFGQPHGEQISLMSPDNTSDGWLKKRWKIMDGKRCLIKGGSGATRQEPYNEVLASRIMDRLGIPHVRYDLLMEGEYPYSVCEDFITPDTELISAWYIMQSRKKSNHISVYQHYLDCCDSLGIPNMAKAMDQMMVVDYLLANEDRHQNNFGVVRNALTLEYAGAAPIYDSGTSLWFDKPTAMIGRDAGITCKPFKRRHEEQIQLVRSFDWLDLRVLSDIDEELRELVRGSLFIDPVRCGALCAALKDRIARLEGIARGHRPIYPAGCGGDVTEDVAYSGETV